MLQAQKRLADNYIAYATLSGKVLDLMKDNPQLEQAVKDHLGPDSKQIGMSKAARNISNLRTEILPRYQEMLSQYGQTCQVTYKDENGQIQTTDAFVVFGSMRNVAKVCQLFDIELQMLSGKFDLGKTEYAQDGMAETLAAQLDKSKVLSDFLRDENRVNRLQNPAEMKKLYVDAVEDHQRKIAQQSKQPELEKNLENQPKENAKEPPAA